MVTFERAWQPRRGSNGHAFKRLGLPGWNSENTGLGERSTGTQKSLERLEAENALLRGRVVELAIQIQALRDALDHPQSEIPLNRYHRRLGYKR